jgi:Rps23 Pro-64 3,4-dihydroxylase Tpa1-like proline 4-hydroxylase
MTPLWRADWGGLLNFFARDGHVAEAYTPTFNSLTIFRVPQVHSVGIVAPFAKYGRFSISGWLRAEGSSAT